jgi:hypothetical protein
MLAWVIASALIVELVAHAALLVGLAQRTPRWRAAVALAVPPLAPYWGFAAGMQKRALTWVVALVTYAIGVACAQG